MLTRMNLELARGEAGAFLIPIVSDVALDISAAGAVRVDLFRLGALADEAAVVQCSDDNARIERVVSSGTTVSFRFLIPADVSAALDKGDYDWRETDVIGGLKTETIGGVLTVV